MKKSIIALAVGASALSASVLAQPAPYQQNQCPPDAVNCTGSNQWSGDVSEVTNNGDTHSSASQLGNSSASNASSNSFDPSFDNRTQTTQNATNTTTGTISGGNTNSNAQGGNSSATGNQSTNDNRSSVGNTSASTGASTSNSGGNTLGGATSNSGGNILGGASSGGNTLAGGNNSATTGNNTNKNAALGGAGGNSNATGGAGGSVAGSGNSANTNLNNTSSQGGAGGAGGQGGRGGSAAAGVAGSGNSTTRTSANLSGGNQATTQRGGDQNASTRSGVGQSGNSQTNVSTGGNMSVDNTKIDARTLILPPMPQTPPSNLAAAGMIKETTACGTLQDVSILPVTAVIRGGFMNWGWKEVDAGTTMHLKPFYDQNGAMLHFYEINVPGTNKVRLYGHQAIIVYAVIGTSSATQTSFGLGGGSAMNWGQGGNGSSASTQRLVADIQLKTCFVGEGVRAISDESANEPMVVKRVNE